MAYFDYSLPETINVQPLVQQVGDALTEAMRRKQQREQFEQELTFKREQEQRRYQQMDEQFKYQNRLAAAKETRDQRDFSMRQDDRNAAIMDRARRAATPQEAAAIAATAARYDAASGKLLSRGELVPGQLKDVGPAPVEPQAPAVPNFYEALPDVVARIPGMPPELAARMRGKVRPEPEAGAMYGPIPSAEETRHAELQRMGTEPPSLDSGESVDARLQAAEAERAAQEAKLRRFETASQGYRAEMENPAPTPTEKYNEARLQYEKDFAEFPGQQQAYRTAAAQAEATRPYTLRVGADDPGVQFDFDTQHNAARREASQRFVASLSGIPMSDHDRQAAMFVAAALEAGTIDPKNSEAAFQKARLQSEAELARASLQTQKDAEAYKRALIPKPGIMLQERRFGFEEGKERSKLLRADMEKFMTRHGAKTIQEDNLQIPQIKRDLNGNQQQQRNAMIALWYMTQHDHRLSDQDAIMAMTVDPSWTAQIGNWVSRGATGRLDPDVQAVALQTADAAEKYLAGKVGQMQRIFKHEFIESGQYDPLEADVIGAQQIPGWQRMFQNGNNTLQTPSSSQVGAPPPEVAAKNRGKKKGGTSVKVKAPSVDEAIELLNKAKQQ